MAAIMSRRRSDITEITKLMDECKAMGIATKGPDVNESRQKFSANSSGEIRFGLAAIKGMGDGAADSIIAEREKNGPFKDIFDFVQRINYSAVNRKSMENLALSGAFDSFGLSRETYFAVTAKGEPFMDVLLRYGQLYQQEQNEARNSLFGGMNEVEIATPAIPHAEEWSTIERLNKERDLVGIYLSSHPLEEYRVILAGLCNTKCQELDDKEELAKKGDVTFGGIVTAVRSKFTKQGKPCGFVTLEDFSGSGELAFFGEDWGRWSGLMQEGCSVFVKAKSVLRWRDSNAYDLRVSDIQYLQTVKETKLEKLTLSIETDDIDDTAVNELAAVIDSHPGNLDLYVSLYDNHTRQTVSLRSTGKKVNLDRDLMRYLDNRHDMHYHIN